MSQKLMKICFYLLLIILNLKFGFISTWAQSQNLYLFNNQINYHDWPVNLTDQPQYYLQVKRDNKWYHNRQEISQAQTFDRTLWQTASAHPYFPDPEPPYFLMDDSNIMRRSFMSYQLTDQELDFINFSFEYQLSYNNLTTYNRPVISLDLCGQENYYIWEFQDATPPYQWHAVSLPNPGTCHENRELKFSMWLRYPHERQNIFKIRKLSFIPACLRFDDQIYLVSQHEQTLALIDDLHLATQGAQLLSSWHDWQSDQWQIGTVVSDKVIASANLPPYGLKDKSLPMTTLDLNQVKREADGSFSLKLLYQLNSPLKNFILGISNNLTTLRGDWDQVHQLSNDYLPNWQQVHYTSYHDGFQIAHFPLTPELANWQDQTFYLAVRAQDHEGHLSALSQIWQCFNFICQKVNSPPSSTVNFSKIFWSTDGKNTQITLSNQASASVNLQDWLLSEGLEEGLSLTGILAPQETKIATISALARTGGHLRLFDPQGQIQDEYLYPPITPPWSLEKNLITTQWKVVYVRN